jgi:hypothetical protein
MMDKWEYLKLKTSAQQKFSTLRPPTEWEKVSASYTSHMGLITRIYRISKN